MNEKLRKSGIDIIGDIAWGTHFCQFYQTKEDLMDMIIPYFKAGLENNEFCLWITPEPLEVEKTKEALRGAIPDFDTYLENGQIELIPYTHWYFKEGNFDSERVLNCRVEKLNKALANGYDGLRLNECTFWLKNEDWNVFANYEKEIDRIIENYRIMTLCTYSLDNCNAAGIIDVIANHRYALIKREGKWEQIENLGRKSITKIKQTENELTVEHTKADNALQGSEERYRMLFDSTDEGLCVIEKIATEPGKPKNFRYIEANPAFEKQTGLKNAVGKAILDLVPEAEQGIMEIYDRVALTGEPIRFETYVAALDLWIDIYAFRIGAQEFRQVAVIFKNVNRRKKAEETLRENEQRYREIVETTEEGVATHEPDGTITYVNQRMADMLGYSQEELIGRSSLDFVDDEEREKVTQARESLKEQGGFNKERKMRRKDGSTLWTLVNVSPRQDAAGNFLGYLAMHTDITERKRAEEKLRESEERFRAVHENSLDRFTILKPFYDDQGEIIDFTYIYQNAQAAKTAGYRPEELVDLRMTEIFPTFPQTRFFAMYKLAVETGQVTEFEDRYPVDGVDDWFRVAVTPIPDGIAIATQIITERKQVEDLIKTNAINLSRAERLASLGHWDWDLTTNHVKWSDGHFRIFGYNVAHGTETYEMFRARVHPDDIEGIERVLREAMEKDTGYNWNYRLLLPDGSIRYVHAEADRPVKDASEKPVRWFGTVQDITEQKLAEKVIRESEQLYRTLFENTEDAFQLLKLLYNDAGELCDLVYLKVNETFELQTGLKVSDVIGKRVKETLPDMESYWFSAIDKVAKTGKSKHIENYNKDTNRWYAGYIFRYGENQVGILFRDITKRKQTEEQLSKAVRELKESEINLAEAQEMAHIGSWDWDITTNEIYWSDEVHRIFELKPQELKVTFDIFFSYVHPDDRDYLTDAVNNALNGEPYSIDYRIILPGGEHTVHSYAKVVFDEKGNPIRMRGTTQDITERIKAEEKIQTLANVVEYSDDAIISESLDGIITSWNKGAEQIYGYSAGEVLGKPISILEPSILVEETEELAELIKQGDKIHSYETLRLRKNDTIINVSLTLSPVYDASGELIAISIIARDITKNKKAEEELRKSEKRYRIVTEQTGQVVYEYDSRTDKGSWAGAIEEVTGYSFEELQKFGKDFWITNIHREDTDLVDEKVQNVRMTEGRFKEELKLRRKDGTCIYIENSGVCLTDHEGQPYGAIGVLKDITSTRLAEIQLKESERKYRSFIQNFHGIAFQADDNFVPVFMHGAVEEITGYNEDEFMSRIKWKDIIHPDDLAFVLKEEEKIRNSQFAGYGDIEFRIKHRDGRIRWVNEVIQKIHRENGKLEFYQGTIYDVTERKETEKFLANIDTARKKEIHHRIKNNLQVISSLLDLQAERFNNRECIEYSEVLEAFRESQDRVISMALIHEELYKGGGLDTLNFSSYVKELAKNLFQTYRLGNASTSLNMNLEENIFLDMDTAVPLGIIVNELVSNSLKHAFAGRDNGRIQIRLCREEFQECNDNRAEGNNEDMQSADFSLTVSDNGIGVPESFDLENPESLGIQLVTALVDQLEGELELKRDNGTEFTIRFTVA